MVICRGRPMVSAITVESAIVLQAEAGWLDGVAHRRSKISVLANQLPSTDSWGVSLCAGAAGPAWIAGTTTAQHWWPESPRRDGAGSSRASPVAQRALRPRPRACNVAPGSADRGCQRSVWGVLDGWSGVFACQARCNARPTSDMKLSRSSRPLPMICATWPFRRLRSSCVMVLAVITRMGTEAMAG